MQSLLCIISSETLSWSVSLYSLSSKSSFWSFIKSCRLAIDHRPLLTRLPRLPRGPFSPCGPGGPSGPGSPFSPGGPGVGRSNNSISKHDSHLHALWRAFTYQEVLAVLVDLQLCRPGTDRPWSVSLAPDHPCRPDRPADGTFSLQNDSK